MGWAQKEFEPIELGDKRLNERAVLLAERLAQKPGASIPAACESWAQTPRRTAFCATSARTGRRRWCGGC
jgi:hypothetical protein